MRMPTRNGVGPTCLSLPAGPWPTVLDFLAKRMPHISREAWAAHLRSLSTVKSASYLSLPVRDQGFGEVPVKA